MIGISGSVFSVQKVLFIGDTKVGNDLLLTVVIKVAT